MLRSTENAPNRTRRTLLALAALALPAALSPQASLAQNTPAWPTRTIKLIIPLGPGSGADISARMLAPRLQARWGQSIVVENRPGGDSLIALGAFAQANDDHVFFYGPAGTITPHIFQHEKLPYDPVKDVRPIASISATTLAIAVPTALGINSLKDLVDRAKKEPGVLNAATAPGIAEMFWDGFVAREVMKIPKVPYRNIAEATNDVGEGRLQIMYSSLPMIKPGAQGGKVKILAITSAKRVDSDPDIPTSAEAGFGHFAMSGLVGMVGSRAVSDTLRRRIGTDILDVTKDAEFSQKLLATGQVPQLAGADEFEKEIERQIKQIAEVATLLGLKRKHRQE